MVEASRMLAAVRNEVESQTGAAAPVLDLHVASFGYDQTTVLRDISLTIKRGETLALIGPSGIGKSSLLRIIARLETGYAGHCRLNGRSAIVFQEPTLLPWRSARANITIPTGISDKEADAALADVGLAELADTYPNRLSLGQQRRLALARAFAVKPDLLLLDEPFVSLDPALADEMMTLFDRLRDARGLATILVTHIEAEARRLADRIVRMTGTPATTLRELRHGDVPSS